MKKEIKKIAILSALLVLLVLFLTVFDEPEKKGDEEKDKKIEPLFTFKEKDIKKIKIEESNKKIVLVKEGENWKITEPINFEGDKTEIDAYVNRFKMLKPSLVLKNKNKNDFGFKEAGNAKYSVFSDQEYAIIKGDLAPDGTGQYAMTNQNGNINLLKSDDFKENGLSPKIKSLRNKNFLKISENELESVNLNGLHLYKTDLSKAKLDILPDSVKLDSKKIKYLANKKQITFKGSMTEDEKKKLKGLSEDKAYQKAIDDLFEQSHKKKWVFPVEADEEVDLSATDIVISDVLNIRADDFIDDPKDQRKIQGNTISLVIEAKGKKSVLVLTKTKDKFYARLQGDKILYEIGTYLYESLSKTKKDLLKKEEKTEIKAEQVK